jgi:hypothetical protein
MKNILPLLFTFLLLQFAVSAFATDYYSIKSGNAAETSIWNSDRNGNGTAPSTFNNVEDNFIIQNGSTITATENFSLTGSLIIETGGIYNTGSNGNTTTVGSVVTINQGGLLRLSQKTSLVAGFIIIQGNLENKGGEISFSTTSPLAYNSRRQKQ